MKPSTILTFLLFTGLSHAPLVGQDDPVPALSGFAEAFVESYNDKNLDAIVALYTEGAELIDEDEISLASGREEISRLFTTSFAESPNRKIGLEVLSVRQIAETVIVEDGIARFSESGEGEADSEVPYSAILVKNGESGWLIATSRELATEIDESEPLAALHPLEGDWTMQGDQMRMDLSLTLSPSGKSLHGAALVTTPAEGTMETEIRIGYDAARHQIRWWTFDELGGYAQGTWQQLEDSWLVRTNGVTASGETSSAIQELTFESDNAVFWKSTHRFLDGVALPDTDLRLVRLPPVPSLTFDEDRPGAWEDIVVSDDSNETETPTPLKP
jgi:ketosteroid isomerase-like protein